MSQPDFNDSGYTIEHDDEHVAVSFAHLSEAGVETFGTVMELDVAEQFAKDILMCVNCARSGNEH